MLTLEVLLSNCVIDFYNQNHDGETNAHFATRAVNPILMRQLCQAAGYSILYMRQQWQNSLAPSYQTWLRSGDKVHGTPFQ